MSFLQRIKNFLPFGPRVNVFVSPGGIGVGSKAVTDPIGSYAQNIFSTIPRQFSELHKYNLENLIKLSSTDLIRFLLYAEPTVSHAFSNYLRVFDSGYYVLARKANGSIHSQGQDFIDNLIARIEHPVSSGFASDTSLSKTYLEFATHVLIDGAACGEVEFNSDYRLVAIHSVDPYTVIFKSDNQRYVPYQTGFGQDISLDYRNFIYIPVDPIANDPYGTNQIISAIQAVMSKFRLLQDFARALHNIGFDRIDIQINQEAIINGCKAGGISNPQEIIKTINTAISEAKTSMQSLEADDNPVHLDNVTISTLEGRNSGRGVDVQAIVDVLLSDIASAMKTYSTILGKRFGGGTEGYTSIEALIFVKLIEGFQKIVKRLLDRVFTLALQVEGGIQAYADWVWLEPSLRPVYESAQYYAVYSGLIWEEEQMGSISMDERNALARRMLGQKGAPPVDAVRVDGFTPSPRNDPQRSVTQEGGKEQRRAATNRDRRSGGNP